AALPENGGEYQLLGRIYHPAVGFIAGVISLVVAFAAPIAACAIAFGSYLSRVVPGAPVLPAAIALLVALSLLHVARIDVGSGWQNVLTAAKLVLIVVFCAAGLVAGDPARLDPPAATPVLEAVGRPAFAVGLVYVTFA